MYIIISGTNSVGCKSVTDGYGPGCPGTPKLDFRLVLKDRPSMRSALSVHAAVQHPNLLLVK